MTHLRLILITATLVTFAACSAGDAGGEGNASGEADAATLPDPTAPLNKPDAMPFDTEGPRDVQPPLETLPNNSPPDAFVPIDTTPAIDPSPIPPVATELAFVPAAREFTSVAVMQTGESQSFTLFNKGMVISAALVFKLVGQNPEDFKLLNNGCLAPLGAFGSCLVTVGFTPTAQGNKSAVLSVAGRTGEVAVALLTGAALPPAAKLSVTPTEPVSFKAVSNRLSAPVEFVLQNTGGSESSMLSLATTTNFFVSNDGCTGKTLKVGQSCTAFVYFKLPTGSDFGGPDKKYSGYFQVASDDSTRVTLSGFSFPEYPSVPAFRIYPATYAFPSTQVGFASASKTFTVTNPSGFSGTLGTALWFGGKHPQDFEIDSNACTGGKVIAAGGNCTFSVRFKPKAAVTNDAEVAGTTLLSNAKQSGFAATITGQGTLDAVDPLVPVLVGYWPLDGDATDKSGLGNNGEIVKGGTASAALTTGTFGYGQKGKSLTLNNPTQGNEPTWVRIPQSDSIDSTGTSGQFGITAWVRPNSFDSQRFNFVVSRQEVETSFHHLGLAIQSGRPTASVHFFFASSAADLPRGAWSHLAASYDGITMRVYVNGKLESSLDVGWPIAKDVTPVIIGAKQNFDVVKEAWDGEIDEVRLYSRPLRESDVKADMAKL